MLCRESSCPRLGNKGKKFRHGPLSRGLWWGARASAGAGKPVLYVSEKLGNGFSCCYRKELLPLEQSGIAQGTLLGRGSRQEEASSFFLLWPHNGPCTPLLTMPNRARSRRQNLSFNITKSREGWAWSWETNTLITNRPQRRCLTQPAPATGLLQHSWMTHRPKVINLGH